MIIISVGSKLLYVPPGFNVLAVELHIQIKGTLKIGKDGTYNLLIRNDSSFSKTCLCELPLKEVVKVRLIVPSLYFILNLYCVHFSAFEGGRI